MSDNFNISDFSALAKMLLEKCDNGDEFLLGQVHDQVISAYQKYPEDGVIRAMASVVDKMVKKNDPSTIITQKQISNIYNDLVRTSGETKFRTILGHLILPTEEMKPKTASHLRDDCRPIQNKDLIDPRVKEILSNTFDDDLANKVMNIELANAGIGYVKAELKSVGCEPFSIKVAGGDSNRIFYSAFFDTVKGPVAVYVPASVSGGQIRLPTSFIDDNGEQMLTAQSLQASIVRRGAQAEDIGLGLKQAEIDLPELIVPKTELPAELSHLARDFENSILEASSAFGKDAIGMGKKVIATELRAAGFKNAQVRFASDSSDSAIFEASIDTPHGKASIEIPLEMKATADDKFVPLLPSCFAYNETLHDFTAQNLQKFATEAVSCSSLNKNSNLYSFMMLSELKQELIRCASVNNYSSCEDIISHIGNTFSEEDYKNAISDYQYILGSKSAAIDAHAKTSEIMAQIGTIIPAGKGSLYPRLANGKPINGMVKDESGRYRSAMEIAREKLNPANNGGAAIQTSQILFN